MKMKHRIRLRPGMHIHFIGIGGIGMSAIAYVLKLWGYTVSGSDIHESPVMDHLRSCGISVSPKHDAQHVTHTDLVVISSAIHEDNPERLAAEQRGIPICHRAQILGEIVNPRNGIVVTGTHGKTTITAMISLLLHKAELDPTCLIGGVLEQFGSNARVGQSEWVVAEGDESDGSFHNLRPKFAIVNNIEPDHLDYYKNVKQIQKSFLKFLEGVDSCGEIWISADCKNARIVASKMDRAIHTYGENAHADLRFTDYERDSSFTHARVWLREDLLGSLSLSIPGRFNMHNALPAVAAGRYAGLAFENIAEVLKDYRGAQRRLQMKGKSAGVTVIDDYAHHPTEIRVTLNALRERFHGRRVGVFQPHRYTRTKYLKDEFSRSFQDVDVLVLTDVYSAGESPLEGVDGEVLFRAIRRHHPDVVYVPRLEEIPDYLTDVLRDGDVLITMGAGNVWQVGEQLLDRLSGKQE
ncbi:MAG TPA: UDP-N-acetylmuramate--L-alanine ligase [bacterium]|nr:UDP-N-acetylmuramate--L-alanine ligase [bacterium]HQL61815.1 UDP-N-acetylmuramate--L-alanine ligase [bacterium]